MNGEEALWVAISFNLFPELLCKTPQAFEKKNNKLTRGESPLFLQQIEGEIGNMSAELSRCPLCAHVFELRFS